MSTLIIPSRQRRRAEAGSSLLEVMIAGLVFMVGLMGGMALIVTAIASNNRSKMDSTATLIAQKTMERIASLPADSSSSVTIIDCNPNSAEASHTVSTAGSSSGNGASLSAGNINFGATAVSDYSMTYYACQTSTGDAQGQYDVRWYIKTLTARAKLIVVSAEKLGTQTGNVKFFTRPVSLKMIVGL